jgi:opacity protein-like surface antigen
MRSVRKLTLALIVVILAIAGPAQFVARAQESQERLAHSNGQGTLKVGQEQFKISSVIIKLLSDRKAEITLVTDITVFLNATWSNRGDSQTEFNLEIVGGATASGLQGTGSVVLGNDGKSVTKLSLKGVSRTSKRTIQADFQGN